MCAHVCAHVCVHVCVYVGTGVFVTGKVCVPAKFFQTCSDFKGAYVKLCIQVMIFVRKYEHERCNFMKNVSLFFNPL